MGKMKVKTADELHCIVVEMFQKACDELNLNSGNVQFNDNKSNLEYVTKITTYDWLADYLQDKYYPQSDNSFDPDDMISVKALGDTFIKSCYKIMEPVFEFDHDGLTFHIYVLLDRIGLMYSYSATSESNMRNYVYLRIKEALGYLMHFFDVLKKCDHLQPAFEEFCKWNNENGKLSDKRLKAVRDGISYIEYFKIVRDYNLAMQPIYDLAKVDVNELAYLQVRFRDGLPLARSEFNKFLKGENQDAC